ncbi:MAG: helix-turn-helix domain-containing protein [Betaproteobacteria bacterium]|nr:helix-turn-helix domain-containing protein [Betaproteobacteria bacterium]
MAHAQRHGTQAIERAVLVLRELAARGSIGWRLSDLAASCGLDRTTTHRVLACLVRKRMAGQRASDRRYIPGPLLFELGLSLPAMSAFQSACSLPLTRAARRTRAVSLLCLRSGAELVCAARAGEIEIKALTIDVGTRRPLLFSVGGVAILTGLPKAEARAIVADNVRQMARFGNARIRTLQRVLRLAENRGYASSQNEIVPGVSAFGVPIYDAQGVAFASISVVGPSSTFSPARTHDVVATLEREADAISREAERRLGGAD